MQGETIYQHQFCLNQNKLILITRESLIVPTNYNHEERRTMKKPATPKARKYAKENNIDLSKIVGSGEYNAVFFKDVITTNRELFATDVAVNMAKYYNIDLKDISVNNRKITKQDIETYINSVKVTTLSSARRVLGRKMAESLNDAPQYTLFSELDTSTLLKNYEQHKVQLKEIGINLSLTDLFIHKVSKVLLKHSRLNANLLGDKLHEYNYVNMALATETKEGIVVPVISLSNLLSLKQIALQRDEINKKAKSLSFEPSDFENGTFTISNIGKTNVTYFTPIINTPQSAILGIGATKKKPIVINDEICISTVTHFSLTLNHTIVDGKDGGRFFDDLQEELNIDIVI